MEERKYLYQTSQQPYQSYQQYSYPQQQHQQEQQFNVHQYGGYQDQHSYRDQHQNGDTGAGAGQGGNSYTNQGSEYTGYAGYTEQQTYADPRDSILTTTTTTSGEKRRAHRPAHFYIPPILRFPSLILVFLISLALIGCVEYGVQKLAHASKAQRVKFTEEQLRSAIPSVGKRAAYAYAQPEPEPQTSATAPSVYVSTRLTSTTSRQTFSSATTSNYVKPTIIVGTTNPDVYVKTTTTLPTFGAAPPDSYVTTRLNGGGGDVSIMQAPTSRYVTTAISRTVETDIPQTYTTSVLSTLVTTDANGRVRTISTMVPTTTVGTKTISTVVPVEGVTDGQVDDFSFAAWIVFVGNSYLPLVVAVIFKQFWTAIYSQAKLIEPFAQMNSPTGANGATVMNLFYLSSNVIPDPIVALVKGNWFIFWNGLVYFSVGVLAPLGSELLFLDTNYPNCPFTVPNPVNPCWPPRLSIDPVIARIVQAFMTYIAIMTLNIMWMVWRMRSGIYADPSSIAAVAALTHHPQVLQDFRSISNDASSKDLKAFFTNKRYKLDEYQRQDGTWRYGIVPAVPSGTYPMETSFKDTHSTKDFSASSGQKSRKWKTWDAFLDTGFCLILLALLGLVAAYYREENDTAFNRFFNSQAFGPRFVLTGTGALIAVNWKRLERDAHTLSPYYRMAQSPASPMDTILLRKSSIPLTGILPMLFRRYFFASFIALIALISDFLIIFLGAVPFAAGQVHMELLVASYISMTLLAIMTIGIISLIVWKRRLPDLPRMPDTLGAVMGYVADARMLEDFEGAEWCDDRELRGRIGGRGKRYVYGKRAGSDGVQRYLVDEESTVVYHS